MNARCTTSLSHKCAQSRWGRRFVGVALALLVGLSLNAPLALATGPEDSALDVSSLYELVQSGQGDAAVQLLAAEATARGGWQPAPGDTVAFDPTLARNVRGAVRAVDRPPADCALANLSRGNADCQQDYGRGESLVRFGPSTFANPADEGSSAPRLAFDDLLATFVEEVGHSWQEYLFETEGRGEGARTQPTTYEDGLLWTPGWEYQVKTYILSLDGTWLALSAEVRAELRGAVCEEGGYANPSGHQVSPFGPPPSWPNPQGWPTSVPTPEALQAFCAGRA